MPRILLNYVYYAPVGHAVEALRYAQGLHAANPGSEIHVALSNRTPWELCMGCPWIARTYPIHLDDMADDTAAPLPLPPEWDYIVNNNLVHLETASPDQLIRPDGYAAPPPGWEEAAMLTYYTRTDTELVARHGRGVLYPLVSLPEGLGYVRGTHVSLHVPAASRAFADRYAHAEVRICLLPVGSGAARLYPDIDTWIAILTALRDRFPTARVYLTGSRRSSRNRTTTRAYGDDDLARLIASDEAIVDCFDIGLWHQVALLERCDLLLSPHTGFAFLALCVGTPWLALSGGNWPEYFFNEVPFYSVLPDNPDYPYVGALDGDEEGPRIPCMQPERLRDRIPEILDGAAFLLAAGCTYEAALLRHQENIARSRVRRDRIPTAASC